MAALQPALIVIVCPHCSTRYQVPPETIGKGRQVACAHCGKTWKAEAPKLPPRPAPKPAPKPAPRPALKEVPKPPPREPLPPDSDRLFDPESEDELDRAFSDAAPPAAPPPAHAEKPKGGEGGLGDALRHLLPADLPAEAMRSIAQIKAALAPKLEQAAATAEPSDAAAAPVPAQNARGKVRLRLLQLNRSLPGHRLRRLMRVAAVSALALTLTAVYFLRTDLVRLAPDLAGLYAAMGMDVNIVGLEFADVSTTRARNREGEVLEVHAAIVPVEHYLVPVPDVVITLFDAADHQVYQWSVAPAAPSLSPGDRLEVRADLPNPPADAVRVVLSFADVPVRSAAMAAAGHDAAAAEAHGGAAHPAPEAAAGVSHDAAEPAPAHGEAPAHSEAPAAPAEPAAAAHQEESSHHG